MPSIPASQTIVVATRAATPEGPREGRPVEGTGLPGGEFLPPAEPTATGGRQDDAGSLRQQAEALARRAQEQAASMRRKLEFDIDNESHEVVIKVRDAETGRLIRQIPPQEVLDLAERLSETVGVLFRTVV